MSDISDFQEPTPAQPQLDELLICDYLRRQPDFFNRHPSLLAELKVPHASGNAVSLIERQLADLRDQNQQLKRQLSHLMSVAASNEHLYRVYGALNQRLFESQSVDELMQAVFDAICGELGHASVTLSILGDHPELPVPCQALPATQPEVRQLFEHRLVGSTPYLGRLAQQEKQLLLLDDSVQSVALLKLSHQTQAASEPLGVLAVGSLYAEHFQPQMGTLLISRMAEVISYRLPQLLSEH